MVTPLPTAKKPAEFIASSKRDLKALPMPVREVLTYAIFLAEHGRTHPKAKPLKGFDGAGVLEVVEDNRGGTYRAVYTLKFDGVVYVLDVFQKKSKKGKATPKMDMDRIRTRLAAAREHYERNYLKRAAGE
jgi:phage-related protein